MFYSIMESLGLNESFFVQFVIFLLIYPVLSKLLFGPYFRLYSKKEKETSLRMKEVEELKKKQELLQAEYERKAKQLNEKFRSLYEKGEKEIKTKSLELRNQQQLVLEKGSKKSKAHVNQEIEAIKKELALQKNEFLDIVLKKLSF